MYPSGHGHAFAMKNTPIRNDSHRQRRAVVVIDVVESVRLMQSHELQTIARWRKFIDEVSSVVLPPLEGRLVKSLGDGLLLDFGSVHSAVRAAWELQQRIAHHNDGPDAQAAIHLRAGVHVADVVVTSFDLFGSGVNLAARLAALAGPGQTMASEAVHDEMVDELDATFVDMGPCYLKHVNEPVRAWRVLGPDDRPAVYGMQQVLAPAALLRPSIAVLSFTGEGDAGLLGRLLADEFARMTAANGEVDVISRLSTRRLTTRRESRSANEFLQHLNATYGVGGECIVRGQRLHVSVELIDVRSDTILWADSVSIALSDATAQASALMAPLCNRALRELKVHESARASTAEVASLETYSMLWGGVTLMHRLTRHDFERAKVLLEAVTERAPRHPEAYAWLAQWHLLETYQGWAGDPRVTASRAISMANRALDLDPQCALALTSSGMVQTYVHHRLDEAKQFFENAIAANHSEPLAWLFKGVTHAFQGEGALAVHDTRRALALSPADPMRYFYDSLGASASAAAGLYTDAITQAQRSLRSNRLHSSTWRTLAISAQLAGLPALAQQAVGHMLHIEPSFTVNDFLARTPAVNFEISRRFAAALGEAGLPSR